MCVCVCGGGGGKAGGRRIQSEIRYGMIEVKLTAGDQYQTRKKKNGSRERPYYGRTGVFLFPNVISSRIYLSPLQPAAFSVSDVWRP